MELFKRIDRTLVISLLVSALLHLLILNYSFSAQFKIAASNQEQLHKNQEISLRVVTAAETLEQGDNSSPPSKIKNRKQNKPEMMHKKSGDVKAEEIEKKSANTIKKDKKSSQEVKNNQVRVKENTKPTNDVEQVNKDKDKTKAEEKANSKEKKDEPTQSTPDFKEKKEREKNIVSSYNNSRQEEIAKEETRGDVNYFKEQVQVKAADLTTGLNRNKNIANEVENSNPASKKESKTVTAQSPENEKTVDLTQGAKSNIVPPSLSSHQPPQYPQQMRRRGIEGRTELKILINQVGIVQEIEVKESSGYKKLDQAAQAAVKQWQFDPAQQEKSEISSWIIVPIKFELNN